MNMHEEFLSFADKIKFLSHFIAKIILYVILILFIFVYLMIAMYFGNVIHNIQNNENRPPLVNLYVIVSPSMVPNINVGDGIVIRREISKNLKKGDIITFVTHDTRYDGLVITHRVVGIEKTYNGIYYFRTKGDANSVEDSYLVHPDDIYGKVIFRIPMLGNVKNFLSNGSSSIILIIIPSIVIIIYDLSKLINFIKKKSKKEEELEII